MAAKSAFLVSAPASRKALYSRSHLCRKRPQTFALSKRHHKSPCMTLGSTPEERDFRDVNIAESVEMQDDMIVNIVDVDEDGPGVVDLSSGSGVKRKKVRHSLQSLIDEIDEETDSIYTSDADGQPPVQEDETARFVRTAVKAADERKGSDIQAMRVSKLTYITSFLIIITGKNTPQIRAIANLVEDDLVKVHDLRPKRIDGVANSGWMLMDYGDFMVNIFSAEQRRNYNLESLWRRAEKMDISDCISEAAEEVTVDGNESIDDWLGE